jgi:hypothetical protein
MSETSISLLLPATIGGGGGSGTVTGASNGLSLSGTDVILGGQLTGHTGIDGLGFAYDFFLGKVNNFLTVSHGLTFQYDTTFNIQNFLHGIDIIRTDPAFNSVAFMGAAPDDTPFKWQGGRSDGRQPVLNESSFTQSGFDFVYQWPRNAGTIVMEDFTPSSISNAYIIELPEASTCEGREINMYYNNLQQANVSLFEGPYTSGVVIRDYLSRGIDFTIGRDNFWTLKVVEWRSGSFKWLVIGNMRTF